MGNGRSGVSAPREARGSERSTAHPRRWKPSVRAGRRPDQPESQCLFASVTGLRGGTRTPSQRKHELQGSREDEPLQPLPWPQRTEARPGTFLGGRRPHGAPSTLPAGDPTLLLSVRPLPSCPQDPNRAGHASRGADGPSPGWRCVYVGDALWLEAKAILAGQGPVWSRVRGEVFPAQGRASRRPCSLWKPI